MDELTALYARTSQEKDDAFSLDSQIAAMRQFAKANGLPVPDEYEFREYPALTHQGRQGQISRGLCN